MVGYDLVCTSLSREASLKGCLPAGGKSLFDRDLLASILPPRDGITFLSSA
ncbi:MAG: hypothetical protein ACHQRJ_21880 [Alphaproteobacteria bacterium]